MKKVIIACLLCAAVIFACKTTQQKGLILQKPGDVSADEYVISTEKDTTLVTKNGALLKIPKGALQPEKGTSVTLEIKEAYSTTQMIKTGLTTHNPMANCFPAEE
jgi:hypothetical protein